MASVAVYSPKGGVGKSTCAVNLAYLAAATSKRRTLLWDIDAQGAAGYLLGAGRAREQASRIFSKDADATALTQATPYPGLSIIAADPSLRRLDVQLVEEDARKRVRKLIRGLETRFERIILDCPPVMSAAGYVSASALAARSMTGPDTRPVSLPSATSSVLAAT